MNDLTPQQIDQSVFDQNIPTDGRKPLRQFIDDKLIPYGAPVMGVPLAAASALGGILTGASAAPRQINV